MAVGKNITGGKVKWDKILGLFGRILNGQELKGLLYLGKNIKFLIMGMGKNIKL